MTRPTAGTPCDRWLNAAEQRAEPTQRAFGQDPSVGLFGVLTSTNRSGLSSGRVRSRSHVVSSARTRTGSGGRRG